MREIKFRAWNPPTTSEPFVTDECFMATQGDPDIETLASFMHHYSDSKHLMQYTGLKDKKGRDIYEGDIVKWGHIQHGEENPIRIAAVKIDPDIQFEIIEPLRKHFGGHYRFHYGNFAYTNTEKFIEVVGNIYENPELLK